MSLSAAENSLQSSIQLYNSGETSVHVGTRTEHKVAASTQRGPESAPNFTGPGSEEPAREQRRRPQEPSRPKPQSNLREVACAVPAEAVLIHQSRD
ncbi:hypothetical protein QTO34_004260 [Cnephaeus nilssonii]|uniref:Uncharacterized protein n=1 Tax=Cnephaeus nilssonii TaxID=3371016 RepID=A0AA40LBQ2_CNENI|nr:hypothetical protein QTO34_004260 [Eptesicus nilssonii]